VKTCQTLARHHDPPLTIGIYAKASLHDISGAVQSSPDLVARAPEPEALRMTGTDAGATRSATQALGVDSEDSTQIQYQSAHAPVAQLDRASVYGTEG
jgi:hypothetical protein